MTDRQIDEALEELKEFYQDPFEIPKNRRSESERYDGFCKIRQALEQQRDEIQALSRMNRALDEKLAEFDGQRVPEGWKLVPVEPTLVMMKYGIGWRELDPNEVWEPGTDKDMVDRIWRAMLAAAPEPDEGGNHE